MGLGCASATPRCASTSARAIQASSVRRTAASSTLLSVKLSVKERVDVGLRVKRHQVVYLLARPDESDGQTKFARNGDDDSAFGGAVELRQHDSRDADVAGEFARLRESILAGRRVHHEQHIVGRAGDELRGGALHFFEL